MPTVTTTPTYPFTKFFKEWRALKGQGTMITDRQNKLRDDMRDAIKLNGEEIEGGHYVWNFRVAVEYEEPAHRDAKGKLIPRKLHTYTGLKAERRLVPAAPTPDPDLAEALLRKKGLWMSEEQERHLEALRISCPNVIFTVEPDVDAVSALYLKKVLSEKEYESVLQEQTEQWAFVPQEAK